MPTLSAIDGLVSSFGVAVVDELAKLGTKRRGKARDANDFAVFDDGRPLRATGRTDMMVACYPSNGAAYGAHIDSVDGDGRSELDHGRCFTMVYYLNQGWDEATDGGALRLYLAPPPPKDGETRPPAADNEAIDVYPHGDTLIMYRADRMVHEVRPAHRSRMATTVWLYGGADEHYEKAKREGRCA